jgi:hypothetical protein
MMAQIDRHALEALLGSVHFGSFAIASLLESLVGEAAAQCLAHPEELNEPPDQIERADELWANANRPGRGLHGRAPADHLR